MSQMKQVEEQGAMIPVAGLKGFKVREKRHLRTLSA